MAYINKITTTDGIDYDIKSVKTSSIPFGVVDSTSTSTAFTATVDGITELYDGVCCYLTNGKVTSAKNWTLNINGLGAKPVYSSLAASERISTTFNVNYTMLFVYNTHRVSGGCWDFYMGYYANTNTIGYQIRTYSSTKEVSGTTARYRILYTSPDGQKWVPANTSTDTASTTAKAVNQEPIDPFGPIVCYATTTQVNTGSRPSSSYLWQQYNITAFGCSYNISGGDLSLINNDPVFLKCAPQSDGSVIVDATTPYVQSLPSTEDGKVYIFLGMATDTAAVELNLYHPVYCYKDGAIRQWTNAVTGTNITVDDYIDYNYSSENPVQNKVIAQEFSDYSSSVSGMIDDAVEASENILRYSNNLFMNVDNPSVATENDYPALAIGNTALIQAAPAVATHGIKIIANSELRPYIQFGRYDLSGFARLQGLIPGRTYTWSFDAEWCLLSDYTGSDTYTVDTRVWLGSSETKQSFGTIIPGEVQTARMTRTFTVPSDAGSDYLVLLRVMPSANESVPYYRSGHDYVSMSNIKLEEGSTATDWTPRIADRISVGSNIVIYKRYQTRIDNGTFAFTTPDIKDWRSLVLIQNLNHTNSSGSTAGYTYTVANDSSDGSKRVVLVRDATGATPANGLTCFVDILIVNLGHNNTGYLL